MQNMKRMSATVILMCALGLSVFAGQTMTPCPPPEPGQTMTPCDPGSPVTAGDINTPSGSTAPGDMGTTTVASSETSFTEIAAEVLLNCLSLF